MVSESHAQAAITNQAHSQIVLPLLARHASLPLCPPSEETDTTRIPDLDQPTGFVGRAEEVDEPFEVDGWSARAFSPQR